MTRKGRRLKAENKTTQLRHRQWILQVGLDHAETFNSIIKPLKYKKDTFLILIFYSLTLWVYCFWTSNKHPLSFPCVFLPGLWGVSGAHIQQLPCERRGAPWTCRRSITAQWYVKIKTCLKCIHVASKCQQHGYRLYILVFDLFLSSL